MLLCVLYRPPLTTSDFFYHFANMTEKALVEGKEMVVTGDLNCILMMNNSISYNLSQFINDHGLKQMVKDPTWVTPDSESLMSSSLTSQIDLGQVK